MCVCATCRVKDGLSRSEQLVRYFYSVHSLGMAYCLAKPRLELDYSGTMGMYGKARKWMKRVRNGKRKKIL